MRAFWKLLVLSAAAAFSASVAGHTVSIGYENAGPGSVTFWFGTYHDCTESPPTEGSFNLVGVAPTVFPSTTVPFTLATAVKPSGLVDGTTNFYTTNANTLTGTDPSLAGPVLCWQGVTFNNLVVGQYQFTYIPIAFPTQKWAPWNTAVTTNTLNLTSGVISGEATSIPTLDPMMLVLLAVAVAALALTKRRFG